MDTIDFHNSEAAFASKSDKELKRVNKLFTLMGLQKITNIGVFLINTALSMHLPVKKLIKKTLFQQFCGGETLEECIPAMNKLYQYGIQSIPDYSVEGGAGEEDHTLSELIKAIKFVSNEKSASFAVFKCSGIAEDVAQIQQGKSQKQILLRERAMQLAIAARDHQVALLVDAEESWLQDHIDQLTTELMLQFNKTKPVIWMTLQMYRCDALARLQSAYEHAKQHGYHLGVKLVRGAYMEKERKRAAEMNYPDPI